MPIKYSKISDYRLKKLMRCFCSDIDATKTAEIIGLNRNTLNRYFTIFREAILKKQLSVTKKFFGEVELDEAYFGAKRLRGIKYTSKTRQRKRHLEASSFWSSTKTRLAKVNGVKSTFMLHLKECEWRWRKSTEEMEKELWIVLKKHVTLQYKKNKNLDKVSSAIF